MIRKETHFKFESENCGTFAWQKLRKKLTIALRPSSENSSETVVDDHRTVLMEWWWCLVTCSRPQVVLKRSCGCGWVGGLINGTHKCYNMIMMRVWCASAKNTPKITKNVTHLVRRRPTHVRLTSRRMMVRSIFFEETGVCTSGPLSYRLVAPGGWNSVRCSSRHIPSK